MERTPLNQTEQPIAEGGMTPSALADELEALGKLDSGRINTTISCIIDFLRSGDVESARNLAFTDSDKLQGDLGENADTVKHLIKTELFRGEEEHPWSFLDRLRANRE